MSIKINPLRWKKQNKSDWSHPIYKGLLGQAANVAYDPLDGVYHMNTEARLKNKVLKILVLTDITKNSMFYFRLVQVLVTSNCISRASKISYN